MILYLLVPVLFMGVVKPQAANVTLGTEEISKVKRNQTFSVSTLDTSTMNPGNATSSLYADERRQIDEELKKNQTSFVTEDNESFQDQEDKSSHISCPYNQLIAFYKEYCVKTFHSGMKNLDTDMWCDMENIIRPYNDMTLCMEQVSQLINCFYPNQATQDVFVHIHSSYFLNCTKEEPPFEDAPQWLVIFLTLIPVSLIPVLTYIVVWKSKVQE